MTQKKHKIKKLSDALQEDRTYSGQEVVALFKEIAVRLEITGRDRRDDLIDQLNTLCTCPKDTEDHLSVCPQSRRIEE